MKKITPCLIAILFAPLFSFAQNTSDLLVKAIEELPDERSVVSQCVKIKNLNQINSGQLDYRPVPHKDGIVFTSNRKAEDMNLQGKRLKRNKSKLFFTQKIKEGVYETPVPFGAKLPGKPNQGAVTFDDSGDLMVYTVLQKKKDKRTQAPPLRLYSSKFENGKWSKGKALPLNVEGYTSCHPSLTPDGNTLYFASNRPGGYGGMDIYKSELVDGKWQDPVNLGMQINTAKDEVFPFINHDGTLYFSSNGKADAENLDIFFSRQDNNCNWTQAINLGSPFNSSNDDFGFFIEKHGLSGLFSSNREGGKGQDDLYFWRVDQGLQNALDQSPVRFTIMDETNGELMAGAEVSLIEFDNIRFDLPGSEDATAFVTRINQAFAELLGKLFVYYTDEQGNFYHKLKHDRNYLLFVEKENYKRFRKMTTYNRLSGVKDISIVLQNPGEIKPEPPLPKENIELAVAEEDESEEYETNPLAVQASEEVHEPKELQIVLNHIYYEYGKTELIPESASVLDETIQMLIDFPEMEITLAAHTDARGNAEFNKSLSQQRADAAKDYLIANGIEASRIHAIGLGEEELLNGCIDGIDCNEDLHSQNRRTEIVITKISPANEIFVKKE